MGTSCSSFRHGDRHDLQQGPPQRAWEDCAVGPSLNSLAGRVISAVTSWQSRMTNSTLVPSAAAPLVRKLPQPWRCCVMGTVCTQSDFLPNSLGPCLS